jgi:hypothetical protein
VKHFARRMGGVRGTGEFLVELGRGFRLVKMSALLVLGCASIF